MVNYLLQILVIFVHFSQNDMTGSHSDGKQKRSVSERNDVLEGEEEEVRFLPAQFGEHNWQTNLDSSNVSSGCSGQTGTTTLQSEEEEEGTNKDEKKASTHKTTNKKFLSPSSAKPKKSCQKKSSNEAFEINSHSCSDYQAKSTSDATVLTSMTVNIEGNSAKVTPCIKVSNPSKSYDTKLEDDIIVIRDEAT